LLELDERCRLVLESSEFSVRRQFTDIQQEIDRLRSSHPRLTAKLEGLYREAHPARVITTATLIGFAHAWKLRLTGEPYTGEAQSA
jgi:hypothetical protein